MKAASLSIALLALPSLAHADVPVIDITGAANAVRQWMESVKQTALESETVANTLSTVHEVQNTVQEVSRVYQQANQIYNSVTGIRDIGSAYSTLTGRFGDPIGVNPFQLSSVLNGRSPQGMLSSLGALGGHIDSNRRLNTVWLPNEGTSARADMQASIDNTSTSQALGEQFHDHSQRQMENVRGLIDAGARAKDAAERENVMIRQNGVNGQLLAAMLEQQASAQAASAAKDAQDLREQQRDQQSFNDFADKLHAAAQW